MSPNSQSPSAPSPAAHPRLPPARQNRSDFDLEPNPFEQSFAPSRSVPSNVRNASPLRDPTAPPSADSLQNDPDRPNSRDSNPRSSAPHQRSVSPRPVLPPLSSISSPSNPATYAWYNNSIQNSLRAGPLSPAMLTAPQANSDQPPPHLPFDSTAFRTGLTPRSGLTPRTGLTPGTGLTPLVPPSVAFPASPGTAALLALMNNNQSASSSAQTITPNTLSAISGVLNSGNSNSNGYPATNQTSSTQDSMGSAAYATAPPATSAAANGLFLLSQAHQELTKREEQARASNANPNGVNGTSVAQNNTKRGTKRKSLDTGSPPPPPQSRGRRRTAVVNGRGRKASPRSEDNLDDDDDDDDGRDDDDEHGESGEQQTESISSSMNTNGRRGVKRPETEEEKRRNFLERNRQAALKCRQRKKAWLAQLQAKVEYLSNENERLTSALVSSREEISRLSALVGTASVVGAVPLGVGVSGVGVGTVSVAGPGVQPVSMNVSLPGKGGGSATVASIAAGQSGRGNSGYGY
ncbi:hypothetical protein AX15_002620 [Amanita polypyramis BW_CC]|nr:hypothetical protein AX15_002620 [Amanita polypyramis BW_CC]